MKKKALIFGISGQDGAYLAQFLLKNGYEVFGSTRDKNNSFNQGLDYFQLRDRVKVASVNLNSYAEVLDIVEEINPNEIYNLSAQSSVAQSFSNPAQTENSITIPIINILEAIKNTNKSIRFFNSASSEIFGNSIKPCNEETTFNPISPYGISKLSSFYYVKNYRENYGLFSCSGILFNHESPLRKPSYVTRKITQSVALIKAGKLKKLEIGNIDIQRDWGFAGDYVEAMNMMLQNTLPKDYVIATGETHSLKNFIQYAFSYVNLNWEEFIEINQNFLRSSDIISSFSDPSKIFSELGWKSKTPFYNLIEMMVDFDLKIKNFYPKILKSIVS